VGCDVNVCVYQPADDGAAIRGALPDPRGGFVAQRIPPGPGDREGDERLAGSSYSRGAHSKTPVVQIHPPPRGASLVG